MSRCGAFGQIPPGITGRVAHPQGPKLRTPGPVGSNEKVPERAEQLALRIGDRASRGS